MPVPPYVVSLGGVALLAVMIAAYGWRWQHTPLARAFTWIVLSVAIWVIFYAFELSTTDIVVKVLWMKFRYIGVVSIPLAWLVFTQQYTNNQHWISKRAMLLLLLVPFVTLGLVWTNEIHQWVWPHVNPSSHEAFPALEMTFSFWFWVHTLYLYVLIFMGGASLLCMAVQTPHRYHWQIITVLVFVLPPVFSNILHVRSLDLFYPLDPTPFAFAFSLIALGCSLVRFGLLDRVAVAHNTIVQGMLDGIIVIDAQTQIVEINPAAQNIAACGTQAAVGCPIAQLLPDQPELLAVCHNLADARIEITISTAPVARTYDVQISVLYNAHGLLKGRLLIFHDITERKWLEDGQRFLAEASDLLASSLSHNTIVATVTRLAIPRMADWCMIYMLDSDQSMRCIALTLADPTRQPLLNEIHAKYPLDINAPHSYPYVMRTGKPELVPEITDMHLAMMAKDEHHLHLLRRLHLRSTMSVPLIANGHTIGAIMFSTDASGRRYNQDDLQLAIDLAQRIALAVDNARLFVHLQASEQRYRSLVAQAADSILLVGYNGRILDANRYTTTLFGYTHAELLNMHLDNLIDIPIGANIQLTVDAIQEYGRAFMIQRKDRSLCSTEITISTFTEHEQQVFIVIIRDTTERRKAENRLHHQNEELTALHETTLSLINRLDVDTLLESIVLRAGSLLNTPHGYLYKVDGARHELVMHIATGHFAHRLGYRLGYGHGLAGRVWKSGQAFAIEDYSTWPERQADIEDLQLHAIVNVPIRAGRDLVGVLGLAYLDTIRIFNSDAIALLQRFADMSSLALERAQLYSAAQREIEERRRTEAALRDTQVELRAAKEMAEAATRAKSKFLAYVSHEMRTPISGVIGVTDLLTRSQLDHEQQEWLNVIRTGGNVLLTLLNNFLDLARIEAGKMDLAHQPFQLQQCIEDAIDLVAVKAAEKQLDIAYAIDASVPEILVGDFPQLRQILVNLLSNAIKFTVIGGVFITVDARSVADHVYEIHVSVEDTGIGISPERIQEVFTPFQKLVGAPTHLEIGVGLGLSISQQLSELMGGRMWVESTVGAGSTFHFTLVSDTPIAPSSEQQSVHTQLHSQRMLIVVEQPYTQQALSHYGQLWDLHATVTPSIHIALDWMQQRQPFDIVVIDFTSLGNEQTTVLVHLDQIYAHTPTTIVLLTSLEPFEPPLIISIPYILLRKPLKLSHLHKALLKDSFEQDVVNSHAAKPNQLSNVQHPSLPLRILLTEDDTTSKQLAVQLLQRMGYQSDTADSGHVTIAALKLADYDMILLDLHLPDVDGLELAHTIRRHWSAEQQPYLVAVTADVFPDTQAQCLRAGINDYITKPITMEALTMMFTRYYNQPTPSMHYDTFKGASMYESPSPDMITLDHMQEPLNNTTLTYLYELFANQPSSRVSAFFHGYCDDTKLLLRHMHEALSQNDINAIWKALHKLKSSSAIIGATSIVALCNEYEQVDGSGDQSLWQTRLHAIETAFANVQNALYHISLG